MKQEMEPLAANEVNFDTSGSYGATHYEFAVPNQEAQSDDEDQLSDHGDEGLGIVLILVYSFSLFMYV